MHKIDLIVKFLITEEMLSFGTKRDKRIGVIFHVFQSSDE